HYKTRAELESAIDNWIRYYNTKRIRSSNNWLTPNAMRLSYKQKIV
ncbi:IS3 family transposase, partial [Companilactobacillus mishanensis]